MSDFYWFWIHCWNTEQEMMKQQQRLRTCMYRALSRRGTLHHPAKSIFYSVVVYFRYIPCTYQAYTCHILCSASLQAFQVSQAHLEVSDWNCLLILSVFATESPPTLGWGLPNFAAKVLQPVVDLINMAAPVWCRALTVSTSEFEGMLLRLSSSILVLNGWGGQFVQACVLCSLPDLVIYISNLSNITWVIAGIWQGYVNYITGIYQTYMSFTWQLYNIYITVIYLKSCRYITNI